MNSNDKIVIKIVYGEGPEALITGIQDALRRRREINLQDKGIVIYIPALAQRYLLESTPQYLTSPLKKTVVSLNINELSAIKQIPGEQWSQ